MYHEMNQWLSLFLSKKHVRTFVPDKIFDKDEFDNVSDRMFVREVRKRTRSYKKNILKKQSTKTPVKSHTNQQQSPLQCIMYLVTRIIDSMHFFTHRVTFS